MNLKEQKYVYTLATSSSLSEAAKVLNISRPALSLYISSLEENLGVPLFDRVGKKFVPTYAGELYIESAKKMLDIKSNFDSALSGIKDDYNGRLRFGVQRYRAPYIAPEMLYSFSREYPGVDITLSELMITEAIEAFENNKLDIFFGHCPSHHPSFEYIPLFRDQLRLAVPQGHPLIDKALPSPGNEPPWIDLKELDNELVLMPPESQATRFYVNRLFGLNNYTPKKSTVIVKTETSMQLVAIGYGVAFFPASYLTYPVFKRHPVLLNIGTTALTIEFAAMYPKGHTVTNQMNYMIQLANDIMKRLNH
ncbi:MAG: LysR family transcriptional regulator [Clostridiaceae bacterium]|nr:LysR family transcriptional regulator [Clostridiaceae bacterium]